MWDIHDETNIMDIRGNCTRRPIRINQYGQVSLSNYIDTKVGFSLKQEYKHVEFKELRTLYKHEMFFLRTEVIEGLELIKYNWRKSLSADATRKKVLENQVNTAR